MARTRLRLTVGLDYGTHSVKCVLRSRDDDKGKLINFGRSRKAGRYPWFVDPSVISVSDGRLFFGREALAIESSTTTTLRMLKVLLVPKLVCPDIEPAFGEQYVDALIASHIACVLQRIAKWIKDEYGDRYEVNLKVNVGAPMNHFCDSVLRDRYLRIMNAAWEISFGGDAFSVSSGVDLMSLFGRIMPILSMPIPKKTERKYEVLPETVAPIVSMARDPSMDSGLYVLLDMGEWTTEMSVVFVADRRAEHTVSCYRDESVFIGGKDFADDCDETRRVKATGVAEKIRRKLVEMVIESYRRDQPNRNLKDKWNVLNLVCTGGAARNPEIQDACECMPVQLKEFYGIGSLQYNRMWHAPRLVECKKPISRADAPILAVADGLSFDRVEWLKFYDASEFIDERPPERIEKREAGWYVGD